MQTVIFFGQYVFVESAAQSLSISYIFHTQQENELPCISVTQLYPKMSQDKL